ncbi:MAG: ring-hydroxylating oxygenase subunit alpha [Gammaproteobacteria bacterium]|nr:MAG: ring-hydroxylating oxygenase subunit alpha [Gammaproteobacteria bacterium]
MEFHPDMGFVEDGVDFTNKDLYKSSSLPFGQATILPPFSYQSKIFSELEDEKLWTRNWIAVGFTNEIPNAGDLLPFTVGHHGIHVQRQDDGSLIGRFNKAQHGGCRAVPLQCQTGKKTKCSFTSCGYSRDRNVIRVEEIGENTPTMHQYLGLIPERLLPVKVEVLGSIIFINLDHECNNLADEYSIVANNIESILNKDFSLQNNEWLECSSNWKFAGRAFFDGNNISNNLSNSDVEQAYNCFMTPSLSIHDIDLNLENAIENDMENIQLCWLFPNLVLIQHLDFLVSVILQPTSMGECTLRTSLYAKKESNSDASQVPEFLRAYIQSVTTKAQHMQSQADELTAPGAPELKNNMIPIETNLAGHSFHCYITEIIETEHDYYWNAPLYSNNIAR